MSSTAAPYGLRPVKRVDGMPYAGATSMYLIDPAGEATNLFTGQVVILGAGLIGQAVEGMPWLGTFHSISARMLRSHAELVGLKSNFTILDPDEAGAIELAAAYGCRWEIEVAFDELKTHQRGPRTVLRSKSPDLVLQEIWGHLCCHFAIRSLMADTAAHTGHDPQRLSFVAALRITRQSIAHQGDFSPSRP